MPTKAKPAGSQVTARKTSIALPARRRTGRRRGHPLEARKTSTAASATTAERIGGQGLVGTTANMAWFIGRYTRRRPANWSAARVEVSRPRRKAAVGETLERHAQDHQRAVEAPVEPGPSDLEETLSLGDARPYAASARPSTACPRPAQLGEVPRKGLAHVLRVVQRARGDVSQSADHASASRLDDRLRRTGTACPGTACRRVCLDAATLRARLPRPVGRAQIAVLHEHLGATARMIILPPAVGPAGIRSGTRLRSPASLRISCCASSRLVLYCTVRAAILYRTAQEIRSRGGLP